jgi:hypothetical protein
MLAEFHLECLQDFIWSAQMLAGFGFGPAGFDWSTRMLAGFGYMLAEFHMECPRACRISFGIPTCLQGTHILAGFHMKCPHALHDFVVALEDLIWSTHMLGGFGYMLAAFHW